MRLLDALKRGLEKDCGGRRGRVVSSEKKTLGRARKTPSKGPWERA